MKRNENEWRGMKRSLTELKRNAEEFIRLIGKKRNIEEWRGMKRNEEEWRGIKKNEDKL